MLSDHTAAVALDELLGKGVLVDLVGPGAELLDIDGGVGVDGLHAQGEAVDAGAGLGVLGVIGGDIADVVVAGLQALEPAAMPAR